MVSPELLRRYPFFAEFSHSQIITFATAAEELVVPPEHHFFYEGAELHTLYLLLEGSIAITLSLPEKGSRAIIPMPNAQAREVTISTVYASEIFAWSALVPPYRATSNARAAEQCRVVAVDCQGLRRSFQTDPAFGYLMMLRVAQVARDRLLDLHYESLASTVSEAEA